MAVENADVLESPADPGTRYGGMMARYIGPTVLFLAAVLFNASGARASASWQASQAQEPDGAVSAGLSALEEGRSAFEEKSLGEANDFFPKLT